MKFRPKISKEEVNQMELVTFCGDITIVDKDENISDAVSFLKSQKIVGVDTETRPSFKKGCSNKVALVQISTEDKCFLFRLNKIGFPVELQEFIADEKIKKIGLSLRDDFNSLNQRNTVKPSNFIDIQTIAKNYGILELSLQKIYAIIFDKKISKSQRLSNWENDSLTEQQKRYAATDAWACFKIYKKLSKEEELGKKELQNLINSLTDEIILN